MVVLFENVMLALEGLRSNKMRALLTMLGIIIGIGSVIGIVTVGESVSASVSSEMSGLGATNIMVSIADKANEYGDGEGSIMSNIQNEIEDSDLVTDEMINQFKAMYPDQVNGVSVVIYSGQGKAQDGRLYANVQEYGVNVDYKTTANVEIINGRFLREEDIVSKRSVAVVSDKFVNNMFPGGDDPIGEEIKISLYGGIHTFNIIGVYKYEEIGFAMEFVPTADRDIMTEVFIPVSVAMRLSNQASGYTYFEVMASPGTDPIEFAQTIEDFFNKYYYANNPRFMIDTMSMETLMSTVTNMLGIISTAIAVIAGISLLVGGIGVMNIMLVSVTERTKEIGTRKALGARNSAIRVQFIVEAMIICAIGGILGIMLGYGIGVAGSSLLGESASPSLQTILFAVLFSMLIGVFFGYYPANKAARLDPIEALRYE